MLRRIRRQITRFRLLSRGPEYLCMVCGKPFPCNCSRHH